MNQGSPAGYQDCYSNLMNCTTTGNNPNEPTECHLTLQRCNLTAGDYYFGIYGNPASAYGDSVSYTVKFNLGSTFYCYLATVAMHWSWQKTLLLFIEFFWPWKFSIKSIFLHCEKLTVLFLDSFQLQNSTSYTQTVWGYEYSHYHIDLPQGQYLPGQKLHVRVSDVNNGEVIAYLNHNQLAGDCP